MSEGLYALSLYFRAISCEQRKRSLSDSTSLKSPSVLTVEQLRKTKSYTTFPHIDTRLHDKCATLSPTVHRTSSFRLMPHLSEDSFPDPNYSTMSVLSLSGQFEINPADVAFELSSDSEDSCIEQRNFEEKVLHSWRRPSSRPRSFSEPVSVETASRARTWSLPNKEENNSPYNETIHKVKFSPSRLQFPVQILDKLKEENSLFSQGQSKASIKFCSSSVMSVVDSYECGFQDEILDPQAVSVGEEVTGHWINRRRRQSITKPPSFSFVAEIHGGNAEDLEVKVVFHIF